MKEYGRLKFNTDKFSSRNISDNNTGSKLRTWLEGWVTSLRIIHHISKGTRAITLQDELARIGVDQGDNWASRTLRGVMKVASRDRELMIGQHYLGDL